MKKVGTVSLHNAVVADGASQAEAGVSDGVGEARTEAEGELALSRLALDEGELMHAATHLGNAVAEDPALPGAYQALCDLDAAAGDGLELFPVPEDGAYIGMAAARSYLLARRGAFDEALRLVCLVTVAEPAKPWTAAGWLQTPRLAERLDPGRAVHALMPIARRLPDPVGPDIALLLRPLLDVARGVAARLSDPQLLAVLSGVARRLGAADEAIAWCQRAEAQQAGTDPTAAIMLGYALRSAGRRDEAHQAWVRALNIDPGNVYLYVDIAEDLASRGRRAEGIGWLDKALMLDPDHEKAFPSSCEMRFAEDGDIGHLTRLADWWRAHPEHDYADTMLDKACRGRPWLNVVPPPTEAVCNALAEVVRGHPDPGALREASGTITLSALEVPSAMAVVSALMPRMTAEVQSVPEPDIRRPLAEVRYRIWDYQQTRAVPNVAPPSGEAAAALVAEASAGIWGHPLAAYDRAVRLSGLRLADLMGLLAHIPRAPADPRWQDAQRSSPAYWPRYAQAWACLALLHHRADEPWPSSTRRAILTDLLRGAEDWVTDAAAFALVVGAWADPGIRADVARLVGRRFLDAARACQQRVVSIAASLAELVLATPGMEPKVCSLARDLLAFERSGEAGEPAGAGGAPGLSAAAGSRPRRAQG